MSRNRRRNPSDELWLLLVLVVMLAGACAEVLVALAVYALLKAIGG